MANIKLWRRNQPMQEFLLCMVKNHPVIEILLRQKLIGHAWHVNQLLYGMSVNLHGTIRSILYNIISIPIRKLSFVCICVRELEASNYEKKSPEWCLSWLLHIVIYLRCKKFRSFDLRLTLGRLPLCSLILFCVSQYKDGKMLLVRRMVYLIHWLSQVIHITVETKRTAWVRPTCS
jgi:hypothetical protein